MSDAKHTPGPWIIEGATVKDASGRTSDDSDIAYVNTDRFDEQGFANLHLIAAAPELLEALERLLILSFKDGESASDRFERVANVFFQETGMLVSGNDCSTVDSTIRYAAFEKWAIKIRSNAREILAKARIAAKGGEQ